MDVPTGRNLLHMIRTYREQKEYWEQEYGSLTEEFKAYVDTVNERLNSLEENIEAERKKWKGEVKQARAPGLGIFAGAGYGTDGEGIQAVIGVGLVWKLW